MCLRCEACQNQTTSSQWGGDLTLVFEQGIIRASMHTQNRPLRDPREDRNRKAATWWHQVVHEEHIQVVSHMTQTNIS